MGIIAQDSYLARIYILLEIELYGLLTGRMTLVGHFQKELKLEKQKTKERCVLRDDWVDILIIYHLVFFVRSYYTLCRLSRFEITTAGDK